MEKTRETKLRSLFVAAFVIVAILVLLILGQSITLLVKERKLNRLKTEQANSEMTQTEIENEIEYRESEGYEDDYSRQEWGWGGSGDRLIE